MIAGGTVSVALLILVAVFFADIYGQLKTTGVYVPRSELIQILQVLLYSSVTVLTLGTIVETRVAQEQKKHKRISAKDNVAAEVTVIEPVEE